MSQNLEFVAKDLNVRRLSVDGSLSTDSSQAKLNFYKPVPTPVLAPSIALQLGANYSAGASSQN